VIADQNAVMNAGLNSAVDALLAVGGNRLTWADLPEGLRSGLEAQLGAAVVSATSQSGGFSPGLASRLVLADGRRAFAKAISTSLSAPGVAAFRREARNLVALPADVPAPRLLWSLEWGEWIALVIEDIDGRTPAQPWVGEEFDRVLAALVQLGRSRAPDFAAHMVESFADDFTGWRAIDASTLTDFAWARDHLDVLVGLESQWPSAVADGASLVHADMRADNLLITPYGVVIVDWTDAMTGPAWADLLFLLPSAMMNGINDPEAVWRRYPPARAADPHAVNAVLAALAGFFVGRSLQPAPEHLPRLRAFQAAQGRSALNWLRERLSVQP
jgi:aminoglycoside phosphotransferase (APT) family kinase protein